jgi:hypothetical protein
VSEHSDSNNGVPSEPAQLADEAQLADRAGALITDQVRSILEEAEARGREIETQARQRADEIGARAQDGASQLLSGINDLVTQLDGVAATLRAEADRLAADIAETEVVVEPADVTTPDEALVEEFFGIPTDPEPAPPVDEPAATAPAAEEKPEPDPLENTELGDEVRRRVAAKTDDELAESYAIAVEARGKASSGAEPHAVGYWDALARAVVDEAARRPTFGQSRGDDGSVGPLERRRRAKKLAALTKARSEALGLSPQPVES